MLHLMFRIYDPNHGQILIDGQDLKGLTFESFRKHIVVVPQNGILFNDTIEANLRYGYPEATQEDLERVARQCSMHDVIMSMSDGY
jgi:ABC-type multidrug transport system fused ATPase/permease subunit